MKLTAILLCFPFILTLHFCTPELLQAQHTPIQDPFTDYERVLQLEGKVPNHSVMNRPYSFDYLAIIDSLDSHPWEGRTVPVLEANNESDFLLLPYNPEFQSFWRSARPGGKNDGPVWQGRGLTTALSGGIFLNYKNFSASFRPVMTFNQNSQFELSPYTSYSSRSVYAYPFGNLDLPQRYGDSSFWSFNAGQSYVKAEVRGWSAGLSNENMWWGPARQNAILMSNNAPGFPHFFAGTEKPKDIYIGDLETKIFWGKLYESDYFDSADYNDERYITGLFVSFSPKPVPGLRVGGGRIFYETIPPEGIPPENLLKVFEGFLKKDLASGSNRGGNDAGDQLLSLFGRWMFPESGFELYAEWSRTDHSWDLRDFLSEPEHTRAYTFGLQKTFNVKEDDILAVNAELTQLEAGKTSMFRAAGSYYVHHRAIQGYTNKGQLVGAGIGPGSNSQHLGGDYYFGDGRFSLWARRTVHNNDFLYRSNAMFGEGLNSSSQQKYWLHNVEFTLGSSLTYFYNRTETSLNLTLSRMLNEHYIYKNDISQFNIGLSFRYHLSPLQ